MARHQSLILPTNVYAKLRPLLFYQSFRFDVILNLVLLETEIFPKSRQTAIWGLSLNFEQVSTQSRGLSVAPPATWHTCFYGKERRFLEL
ncbi:hypothetical protein G6F56_009576 [Rhizopus delemar]|nr:hypothetical protein G6F56_009576 [Rhizopus delemar]